MKTKMTFALIGAAALSAMLIAPVDAQQPKGKAAQPVKKRVAGAKKVKAIPAGRIMPKEMVKAIQPKEVKEEAKAADASDAPKGFLAPKLLKADDKDLGTSSRYPSPTLFDVDNDGVNELVVGGLFGYLSVAQPKNGSWGKEARLKATDGKDLKFSNW